MRTTVDIDAPILEELKALGRREGKSLGRLVSELLASALAASRSQEGPEPPPLVWTARRMAARVDLADRDAVYDALEAGDE